MHGGMNDVLQGWNGWTDGWMERWIDTYLHEEIERWKLQIKRDREERIDAFNGLDVKMNRREEEREKGRGRKRKEGKADDREETRLQ